MERRCRCSRSRFFPITTPNTNLFHRRLVRLLRAMVALASSFLSELPHHLSPSTSTCSPGYNDLTGRRRTPFSSLDMPVSQPASQLQCKVVLDRQSHQPRGHAHQGSPIYPPKNLSEPLQSPCLQPPSATQPHGHISTSTTNPRVPAYTFDWLRSYSDKLFWLDK